MADKEFDDVDEPDLVEDAEVELDEELDLEDDPLDVEALDVDALTEEVAVDADGAPAITDTALVAKAGEEEEDDVVDLDEELHPDDVEEPLDVLLAERTATERLEEDETEELEEDEGEPDERGDGSTRIVPRRADEFLCSSCFLVLPLTQLADPKKKLCRDCV
jgi:hypothetical protein